MSDVIYEYGCEITSVKECPLNKEIRADERAKVIDEIAEAFNEHLFDSPMINPIMTRNEILLFLNKLKEQK